jgi:hypothetical protein
MKIDLTVKLIEGEPVDVSARFADFVAFERTWNRSVAKLENDTRLTDIAWLAWHALKRTRQTALVFDPDWINTVEEVIIKNEGDDFLAETQPTG